MTQRGSHTAHKGTQGTHIGCKTGHRCCIRELSGRSMVFGQNCMDPMASH